MHFYEELVMQTQRVYSQYPGIYAAGGTPYVRTDKPPLPYPEQIARLVREIREADCVVVGGASGLSAAGGGDFYYADNASYRKYFGKYKVLFFELGVGRLTPMFIQEPFWHLTLAFPHARYIAVNRQYNFLPKGLEEKGMVIVEDIAKVLRDARAQAGKGGDTA